MGTLTVPVTPFIAKLGGVDNVVLSLADIAPANMITLADRPAADSTYTALDLSIVKTNFSVLASLGFGDFMSTKISSNTFCSYMDLVVSQHITPTLAPDSIVVGATFGLGFRLAILAYDIDASFSASFADIAAAAKLKMGYTSYQIIAVGGGLQVIGAAQPLIGNLTGEFTVETLESIGAVQAELTQLYVNKNKGLTPELLSVDIDLDRMAKLYSGYGGSTPRHYMDVMSSQHYALQRAWRGRTLTESLADIQANANWSQNVTPDIVTDFYTRILGLKADQVPDADPIRKRLRIMLQAGT